MTQLKKRAVLSVKIRANPRQPYSIPNSANDSATW